MSLEWITIIVSLIAVLSAVGWFLLFKKGKELIENCRGLYSHYCSSIEDGTVTEDERTQLVEHLVIIIEDATIIVQTVTNLIYRIVTIFKVKRG
jgi:hypothetical protein